MIPGVALLDVLADETHGFERAFAEASEAISLAPGYISHELQREAEAAPEGVGG